MTVQITPLQYIPAGMRTWVTQVEQSLKQIDARLGNRNALIPANVTKGIAYASQAALAASQSALNAQTTASSAAATATEAANKLRSQSILPNSDFVSGLDHWPEIYGDIEWNPTGGRNGTPAVQINRAGPGSPTTAMWSEPVPVSPGQVYTFNVWVKSTVALAAESFTIFQQQIDGSGAVTGDSLFAPALAAGVWTEITLMAPPIDPNTVTLMAGLFFDTSVVTTFTVDRVNVYASVTGESIVPGALNAFAIRSPDIATSDGPDRITYDSDGFFQYVGDVLKSYWTPTEFQIVDGEIIGSTITGSLIRTAATGPRVEISGPDPADPQKKLNINMIGSDPLEVTPGGVSFIPSDSITGPDPTIILQTPLMGDGGIGRYSTSLSLGSNRRFELTSLFQDTSNAGNNRSTDVYGDPAFLQAISGSVTIQGWNNVYLQYTDLDPATGLPSTQYNRIALDENGVYLTPIVYFPTETGTETDISLSRAGTILTVDNNAQNTLLMDRTIGRLRISGVDVLTWDSAGIAFPKKLFLDAAKTQSITNTSSTIWINNNDANTLQMGTGSGRFQLGGQDKLVWGSSGVYIYNQLFMRTTGGSESDMYISRPNASNFLIQTPTAFQVFSAAYSSTDPAFAVTTPLGSAGLTSLLTYNKTTTGSANLIITDSTRGIIWRTTSLSKFKLDQKLVKTDYRILNLQPKTWIDKTAKAQYKGYKTRTVGLIAEEVEKVGIKPLSIYDPETGALEGVAYDRGWVYLIPIVREHHARLEKREADDKVIWSKLGEMQEQIAALTAQGAKK